MGEYFFGAYFLPEVEDFENVNFLYYKTVLLEELSNNDKKSLIIILKLIDLDNIRLIISQLPLHQIGNFNQKCLESAIENKIWPDDSLLEPEILDFLETNKTDQDRLENFPMLRNKFIFNLAKEKDGFLKKYFTWLNEYRITQAKIRAERIDSLNLVETEIKNFQEDCFNDDSGFSSEEYKNIKQIFENKSQDPIELRDSLFEYKRGRIRDMYNPSSASIEKILGWVCEYLLWKEHSESNKREGVKVLIAVEKSVLYGE